MSNEYFPSDSKDKNIIHIQEMIGEHSQSNHLTSAEERELLLDAIKLDCGGEINR